MATHETDLERTSVHSKRNAATRIDVFEELSPTAEAAFREFFRRLGAPQYVDEVLLPTLRVGEARVFCTVRDRPWPPWGLGARTISGYCEVHSIAPDSWAPSPVYLAPEDATNVGLAAALFREVLESLAVSETAEICYLAADGSVLVDRVLVANGFRRDDDVFLTEEARYFTYRAAVDKVIASLHLDRVSTPDLLNDAMDDRVLTANALFAHTLQLAARPEAILDRLVTELLPLPRGGHADKPGGVPGGTGTGMGTDQFGLPGDILPYVSLSDFLGDRVRELVALVRERQGDFRPATVVDDQGGEPTVDERVRKAVTLDDVGPLHEEFVERLKGTLPAAIESLGMEAFPVGRIEVQVTASGDGAYYRMHRDADARSTRALSFVYFFHEEPRSFFGGELRLFDDRGISPRAHADNSQLLSPRQDTLVLFPSHLPHELLPVRVPGERFSDGRFTVNGWVHRG